MNLSRTITPFLATFVAATLTLSSTAFAFCGFYVAGGDKPLVNNATNVVLMREGTTTVLSMQNDYQGPPENFAMVVPVPEVLAEENVKTLPRDVFARIDKLASPRLVEYWEQNPCEMEMVDEEMAAPSAAAPRKMRARRAGASADSFVKVEAEFAVGEYDIVILSSNDSDALDTWLRDGGYKIPAGSAELLRPYVEAEMKFFVAKVDVTKVTFKDDHAVLSPLRVSYDSEQFSLPVRLGMINSSGKQDLIVHVLGNNKRYEVANYENVTIPTNLEVSDEVRERFGDFYSALFDETTTKNPNAVVTEYAWQSSHCDPCPGPVLSRSDLSTLGADVAFGAPAAPTSLGIPAPVAAWTSRVLVGLPKSKTEIDTNLARRAISRISPALQTCHQTHAAIDGARGKLSFSMNFRADGSVSGAPKVTKRSMAENPALDACFVKALKKTKFKTVGSAAKVSFALTLRTNNTATSPSAIAPRPRPMRRRRPTGGRLMGMVLTRLHYRYTKEGLGEDLVFRPAAPIYGGREHMVDGKVQQGVTSGTGVNNFQGRYIIRHTWEGEIACDNPRRGNWGGPPSGGAPKTSSPGSALENQDAGPFDLKAALMRGVPALGVVVPDRLAAALETPTANHNGSDYGDEGAEHGDGNEEEGSSRGVKWNLVWMILAGCLIPSLLLFMFFGKDPFKNDH